MPRPERALDPAGGPVPQFAAGLRHLRLLAGNPTYRQMSQTAYVSKASLAAAASGHRLPTWEVTLAFVEACAGDVDEWRRRWEAAFGTSTQRLGRPTRRTQDKRPRARIVGGIEQVADNADPKRSRCAEDPAGVFTLDAVEVNTRNQEFLGVAELRYSPTFRAAWGRFVPGDRLKYLRAEATVTIVARRPATNTVGTPFAIRFDGQAVFGNILLTELGCVEVTVTIDSPTGSGTARTAGRP